VKHGTGAFCIYLEYQDKFETNSQEILTVINFCCYQMHRHNTDYVNSVTIVACSLTGVLKIPNTENIASSNGSFTVYCLNIKKQYTSQLGSYRIKRIQLNIGKLACIQVTESNN
jgi:uncharacterized membrane protein